MRRIIIRVSNLVAGMFILLATLNIYLSGYEVIIGAFLAGLIASYREEKASISICMAIASVLLFYLVMTAYYYLLNPYGVMVMFKTGPLLYVPIVVSIIAAFCGGLIGSVLYPRLKTGSP